MMKKLAALSVIAVLFLSCISQPAAPAIDEDKAGLAIPVLSQAEAVQTVNTVMAEMDELIKKYATAKELREVWKLASGAVREGKLTFDIDFEDNSILYGGAFKVLNDYKPRIQLSNGILRVYRYKPSILMSVMIHEFTHAYFYLTIGKRFLELSKDRKEGKWYEADAIHIEAVFVEECL